ncbi:hypothetical protein F2P81_018680 [Scophthalmus maximus]|uniref:Uncharacterized protein n=1 Tax=Scophthalmus maximus TaxID=52904 RepID=A0A6A4SB13_SCOMX|nr:hypothetical protein F2P81_018680 [Scophthalmus maximus]
MTVLMPAQSLQERHVSCVTVNLSGNKKLDKETNGLQETQETKKILTPTVFCGLKNEIYIFRSLGNGFLFHLSPPKRFPLRRLSLSCGSRSLIQMT